MVWFSLANLYRASNGGDFFINLTMHSSEAYLYVSYQADCLLGGCLSAISSFSIQNLVLGMLFSQIQANKIIIHLARKWKRYL